MNPYDVQNFQKFYLEAYRQLDEANRVERHLGIHSNTPEHELARMKRRASASGIGSGNDNDTSPGTLRMNRDLARMVTRRNRGKSPSDSTYRKRRGIDPYADVKSWRDSPLGLPTGYKDPLKPRTSKNIGNKVKVKTKPARVLWNNPHQASNTISKFRREDYDIYNIVISHLLDEGYANCLGSAEIIMENMSEDWAYNILEAKWGKQPLPAEKMMKKAGRHDYYAGWLRGEYEGNRINKHKKKNITQEMEDESKGRANKIRQVLLQKMSER